MKATTTVQIDLDDLAFNLNRQEAEYLIKEIDQNQADWDFTKDTIIYLIKQLVDEGSGDELVAFKKEIKRLLK